MLTRRDTADVQMHTQAHNPDAQLASPSITKALQAANGKPSHSNIRVIAHIDASSLILNVSPACFTVVQQ